MEKADWIRSIENDFDLCFFGHGVDGDAHKVFFEPSNGGARVIKIDSLMKRITIKKPTHCISGEERKLPCHQDQGRSVSNRLFENIENWAELGLEEKFRTIDEIDVWFIDKKFEWIIRFDGKEKENAFGRNDWAEF